MNKFVKITVGFVHQTFEENTEGKFVCTEQAFIASDQCDYEDLDDNPLEKVPEYGYQPYEMVQPQNERQVVKYLLYNDALGSLESEDPIEAATLEEALTQVLINMGYSIIESEINEEEE
ncbi:hypothetical protein ACFL02_07195 [Planctomycetota bacterium]